MKTIETTIVISLLAGIAGCTTVAAPAPNSREVQCQEGEYEVCSGATATRLGKDKDPHAVCRCEPRNEPEL